MKELKKKSDRVKVSAMLDSSVVSKLSSIAESNGRSMSSELRILIANVFLEGGAYPPLATSAEIIFSRWRTPKFTQSIYF